jgi:hypothetical protein
VVQLRPWLAAVIGFMARDVQALGDMTFEARHSFLQAGWLLHVAALVLTGAVCAAVSVPTGCADPVCCDARRGLHVAAEPSAWHALLSLSLSHTFSLVYAHPTRSAAYLEAVYGAPNDGLVALADAVSPGCSFVVLPHADHAALVFDGADECVSATHLALTSSCSAYERKPVARGGGHGGRAAACGASAAVVDATCDGHVMRVGVDMYFFISLFLSSLPTVHAPACATPAGRAPWPSTRTPRALSYSLVVQSLT